MQYCEYIIQEAQTVTVPVCGKLCYFTIWILLKQETVSGNGISWAICKSAPRSRQITMPAPYHSVFLQAGCPSCRPTNSVKVLKAHNIIFALVSNYAIW